MLRTLATLGLVGCLSATSAGCAAEHDPYDDEKSVTESAALDHETSSAELDAIDTLDPARAALAAAKTDACRTRSVDPQDPNVVHITLNGCTGRFMHHVVNGTETITFSKAADGRLHAETVGDLTVDGRPFTRKVSSDIQIVAGVRTITRHVERTGTKANGESVEQTADETVVVDESTHCRTVNGTGHSLIDGTRSVESITTDLRTCELAEGSDQCPTGTIEHINQSKGKTVLATFDGSATATIEISKPKRDLTKTWTLDCTPH